MSGIKRFVLYIAILAGLSFSGSCDEYLGPVVDCDNCYYEKPDSEDLVIYLTINETYPEVPITIYRGDYEKRKVDWVDTAYESPYYLYSKVDQLYSVAAEYKKDGKTIIAVDGDIMKAKHVTESCDEACWVVTGGYLKVELKFD